MKMILPTVGDAGFLEKPQKWSYLFQAYLVDNEPKTVAATIRLNTSCEAVNTRV
ncbi:hypothetical protein [Rufibacter roseolus]|uniref:hypothetical protein n=1 Tax=Rufibacter roseolus TaxID=2817375 RepID=UPI001B30CEA5|nr:hypothetical protein [Rufibacter roseolus]